MSDIAFTTIGTDVHGAPIYDIENRKVEGVDVVAQKIAIRLAMPRQEWAADPSIGVALSDLAQFASEPTAIAQLYADAILQVPKVSGADVVDINTEIENRVAVITFNVSTSIGTVTITT